MHIACTIWKGSNARVCSFMRVRKMLISDIRTLANMLAFYLFVLIFTSKVTNYYNAKPAPDHVCQLLMFCGNVSHIDCAICSISVSDGGFHSSSFCLSLDLFCINSFPFSSILLSPQSLDPDQLHTLIFDHKLDNNAARTPRKWGPAVECHSEL